MAFSDRALGPEASIPPGGLRQIDLALAGAADGGHVRVPLILPLNLVFFPSPMRVNRCAAGRLLCLLHFDHVGRDGFSVSDASTLPPWVSPRGSVDADTLLCLCPFCTLSFLGRRWRPTWRALRGASKKNQGRICDITANTG